MLKITMSTLSLDLFLMSCFLLFILTLRSVHDQYIFIDRFSFIQVMNFIINTWTYRFWPKLNVCPLTSRASPSSLIIAMSINRLNDSLIVFFNNSLNCLKLKCSATTTRQSNRIRAVTTVYNRLQPACSGFGISRERNNSWGALNDMHYKWFLP